MTTSLRLRRGTTAQHSSFTGGNGEVTVDTTKKTVVVHDGSTAGGIPLATEASVTAKQNADAELTTLAGMSANRASFLASNENFGHRNRIINGAMMIDQRNAGAAITTGSGFPVDRFQLFSSQASKFSAQQNAGSVTPPAGFTNYLGFTSSSAYSVGTSEAFSFYQPIEGFTTADLNFGTANAATITVSFWVRSSLTGTFGGAFNNYTGTRAYPFSYTISAANTWEYKTITIPGDTSGTWVGASNAGSSYLMFSLGAGSGRSGTAGAWVTPSTAPFSVTGAVSVVGTNGATFYITGVQLEKGSTATSFDYRPYGTELQLCQRYYDLMGGGIAVGNQTSSTNCGLALNFRVPKRASPTLSLVGTVYANDGATQATISSISSSFYGESSGILMNLTTGTLVANRPSSIYSTAATSGLAISAEL